jgi:hypothetical protein
MMWCELAIFQFGLKDFLLTKMFNCYGVFCRYLIKPSADRHSPVVQSGVLFITDIVKTL